MSGLRLVLDPIACEGHGLCVELLPELIALDEWGDPLLLAPTVALELERHAQHAVRACPTLALSLVSERGER